MRFAVINLLRSAKESVEVAKACEAAGFWGLGLGDTVPKLYQESYATTGACFAATEKLHVGPAMTNTVTRHWSVLGAGARTFNELYDGRFFAGVATGDGACHSVGLKPASWGQVEQDLANARSYSPDNFQIQIAASGPKGCETAGRVADDLIIGTGLEVEALKALSARARAARAAAGITRPLRVWGYVNCYVAPNQDAAQAARVASRGRAAGTARYSFSFNFEDKAVPETWQPILRERLARYDHSTHGMAGPANINVRLFEDHPEIQDYLTNRFQLIGTADDVVARLGGVAKEAGLDGCWFALAALSPDEDSVARHRTTGETFRSLADA